MGVKGLTTFLAQYHEKYSEAMLIRNQYLVIDGSNLQYFLFFKNSGRNSHLFGGDFFSFAKNVREFFGELRLCFIKPVVIVDGAVETEKMGTVLKRYLKWLRESFKIDAKHPTAGRHFHSVWMSVVFHQVLTEMNILQVQTEWDADDTIAMVAKFLHCPILSFDSDFYIYSDVNVISLNDCDFCGIFSDAEKRQMNVPINKNVYALSCTSLRAVKLWEEEFNVTDKRMLTLMAAMLGNDYIPSGTFNRILYKIEGYQPDMKNQEKIVQIMKWVKIQTSFDAAISEMLNCVRLEEDRQCVQDKIEFIMKSYLQNDGAERKVLQIITDALRIPSVMNEVPIVPKFDEKDHVLQNSEKEISKLLEKVSLDDNVPEPEEPQSVEFDGYEEDYEDENQIESDFGIISHKSTKLPDWFLAIQLQCKMYSAYHIKIAYNKAVFLYPQMELPSLPNSHEISIPIIRVTAGIILGEDTITFVTKEQNRVSKIVTSTITRLGHMNLPCLLNAKFNFAVRYGGDQRQKIILASMNLSESEIQFIYRWPLSLQLCVASILYFVKMTGSPSSVAVALAVMISFSSPHHFPNQGIASASDNWRCKKIDDISLWLHENQEQISDAKMYVYKRLARRPIVREESFKHFYDKERLYVFTQFKNVLYHVTMLNKLLLNPFKDVVVIQLSCIVIYNVLEEIVNLEYKFMDFIEKNFERGRYYLLKEFLSFLCKENNIRSNGVNT